MASAPAAGQLDAQVSAALWEFCAQQYEASRARQFGIDEAGLAGILAEVAGQCNRTATAADLRSLLASLHLEELILARACVNGSESAWEIFLLRYRRTLYESAYKIARTENAARELADSLYAELYGVDAKGQERTSKLRSYQGRGSLQGWLRTVLAQEYINHYRSTRHETSLNEVLDGGRQFEAREENVSIVDTHAETAAAAELATLEPEGRFLLAAYYLDRRTLSEIATLMGVHESTISRKLERVTSGLRKRIRKRMIHSGMSPRQADEAMQDVDVRDLRVKVKETLRQETPEGAFYKEKDECG